MTQTHELKVQTHFWKDLYDVRITAQLREDDRLFRVGNVLLLREYDPKFGYTGAYCRRTVTHILRHEDVPNGLTKGWCILSLATEGEEAVCTCGAEPPRRRDHLPNCPRALDNRYP